MNKESRDTITVLIDHREGSRGLRPFYCVKCGRCVCEVMGDVSVLLPGAADPVEISSITAAIHCYGYVRMKNGTNTKCDAKYIF